MKKILLILFMIIAAQVFSLGCAQQENPYFYDFGSVKEGDILVHTFSYKNGSQIPLVINDLQPSCSCTVVEVSIRNIPPGGGAEIKVTVDSAGRHGQMTQYVYVQTDNLSEPVSKLIIKANITPK